MTGTAGVVPDSQWNNATVQSGTNIAIHDSANAAAGTLTYISQNTWWATGHDRRWQWRRSHDERLLGQF